MDSITEEKIAILKLRLKDMKVGAENAWAAKDEDRLVQAKKLVSMVENQLRELGIEL